MDVYNRVLALEEDVRNVRSALNGKADHGSYDFNGSISIANQTCSGSVSI